VWFIDDKKNFVAMSDHHHRRPGLGDFAARVGVQESLIEEDSSATFGHVRRGRGWVGAYLDGHHE